jgi:hypothetical protein
VTSVSAGFFTPSARLSAVLGIAQSEAPLHERVASAHTSSLIRLDVDELPADLRAPFQGVINVLSRISEGGVLLPDT